MNVWFVLKVYLLTVPVFFAVDLLWLGVIARGLYKKYLGFILSPEVNWPAAIAFYVIYIAGILVFAVFPALRATSATKAIYLGALFGFFTYATYDLTNLATIKDWPLTIVFIDMAWGACLCAAVSLAGYGIGRWLS